MFNILFVGLTMGKVVKDRTIGVGGGKSADNNNRQVTSHSEAVININININGTNEIHN